MIKNKAEIESLFKKMLNETEENAPKDAIYQEDIKTTGTLKVQWKICGILGYQIYDRDDVFCKFGEEIEEPDVTLSIREMDLAARLLKGEPLDFDLNPGYKGAVKINYTEGWKVVESEKGKKRVRINKPFITARFNREKNLHPYILSKLPIFRNIVATRMTEDDIGFYIPINK